MHQDHAIFLKSLHAHSKVRLTYYRKEDKARVTRLCAPLDFGTAHKAEDKIRRYEFWDHEAAQKLSLVPSQIRQIEDAAESFDPAAVVTWRPRWVIKRSWGTVS